MMNEQPRPAEGALPAASEGASVDLKGSRERILDVALEEFADKGLSGARVDQIAERVQTSKRMIYYHFSGKDDLYKAVLARAYEGIRVTEAETHADLLSPEDALRKIVETSFNYHHSHPAFVRLVMNENIHRARHMDLSTRSINHTIIETLKGILDRGVRSGAFRSGIDPLQLHLTISALGFHYVANHHTFTRAFDLDMSSAAAVAERRRITIETVLCWVRRPGGSAVRVGSKSPRNRNAGGRRTKGKAARARRAR